ncbi:MAG: TadE/TadG family type IV pilus assembly protein [Novosphingobium sp.]|uniref:TadE/TadG family type IV pilus assembly protein n=1 Tax=Novosphingobium sp. TaxID=1874826 RepID=UPI0032B707DF
MIRRPRHLRPLGRLVADRDGVTALEFALIAPTFMFMMIGSLDLGQMAYGSVLLNGAVEKAARDSTLETANTSAADTMVKGMVSPILPNANFTSTRTSYFDFVDVGRPERWNDGNADGTCNNSEAYVDENINGHWDNDIGLDGNGGANDVIVYKVTVKYKALIQIPLIPTAWYNRTLSATTVKKNQPFAYQEGYGSNSGVCS